MAEIDTHEEEVTRDIQVESVESPDPRAGADSSIPVTDHFNNRAFNEWAYTGYTLCIKVPSEYETGQPIALWRCTPFLSHPCDMEVCKNQLLNWTVERPLFLIEYPKQADLASDASGKWGSGKPMSKDRSVFFNIDSLPPQMSREAECHRYFDGGLEYLFKVQSTVNVQGDVCVALDDQAFVAPVPHDAFKYAPKILLSDPTIQSLPFRSRVVMDLGSSEREWSISVPKVCPEPFDLQRFRFDVTQRLREDNYGLPPDQPPADYYEKLTAYKQPPSLVFYALGPIVSQSALPGVVRIQIWYRSGPGFVLSTRTLRPISHIQLGSDRLAFRVPGESRQAESEKSATQYVKVDVLSISKFAVPSNKEVPILEMRPDSSTGRMDVGTSVLNRTPVLPPINSKK